MGLPIYSQQPQVCIFVILIHVYAFIEIVLRKMRIPKTVSVFFAWQPGEEGWFLRFFAGKHQTKVEINKGFQSVVITKNLCMGF